LHLHRNIDKFNFPQHLDDEKRRIVLDLLSDAIKTNPDLEKIEILPVDMLPPLEREFLEEHFLIFDSAHNGQHGQSYITDKSETLLIQCNTRDHLELHIVEPNGELEKALERIIKIEQHVEKRLPFAFSHVFGYLTSDPCLSGTGLVVNAYLHVPALNHQEDALGKINGDRHEELIFTSIQGNPDDLIGDLLVIRNRWTTGVTEETILSAVRNTVLQVIMEEKQARAKFSQEREDRLVDRISRAIGTLQNSYTIDTSEALRALSLVKLGIEMGWITGMDVASINELFFDCRRAHLAKKTQQEQYTSPALHKVRAQLLRNLILPLKLT
jgi:protein arginine kinase